MWLMCLFALFINNVQQKKKTNKKLTESYENVWKIHFLISLDKSNVNAGKMSVTWLIMTNRKKLKLKRKLNVWKTIIKKNSENNEMCWMFA